MPSQPINKIPIEIKENLFDANAISIFNSTCD